MTSKPELEKAIKSVNCWNDLKGTLRTKSTKEKGDVFELLTKQYLTTHPTYRSKLKYVWLEVEVPQAVRKKLNLPSGDQGIDLVAETKEYACYISWYQS